MTIGRYERLKAHVDGILSQAEQNLHGSLALEPNDPARETQVNHWNDEDRKARQLMAKLGGLRRSGSGSA